jgi:hypothetical protein
LLYNPYPTYDNLFTTNNPYLQLAAGLASPGDAVADAESAVKALREAKDKEGQRRAAEALEKAMKKLREQLK